tara:strand:+ start:7484 stop:7768 length:285 start_codon:yes stop_codon:yes gene_type:complete
MTDTRQRTPGGAFTSTNAMCVGRRDYCPCPSCLKDRIDELRKSGFDSGCRARQHAQALPSRSVFNSPDYEGAWLAGWHIEDRTSKVPVYRRDGE